ncbi:murein L,D-transpeptidase catalytic domain family protein [Pontibacter sp. MBLB2868]|uniref:murein L,D-transpeptidase catalytic domain family protein n=1 Tax=Pontibacter sp. MBLB2868 TaxID=3451555 RepID=UPI003F756197
MLRIILTSLTLGLLSFISPVSTTFTNTPQPLDEHANAVVANANTLSFIEKKQAFDEHLDEIYSNAGLKSKGLSKEVFRKAFVGYQNFLLRKQGVPTKPILTVVDFTKPSRDKRMWIIDLKEQKLLFNTLVAHGRNTGEDKATKFSNKPNSYMSSIGFYLTDATYYGKHGLSLRLSGMDGKYNSNAMSRAIVVHGAEYVSESFVKQYGRLGRSLGCPSVPLEISKDVIETIKNKTVIYVHGNDTGYTSNYLDQDKAIEAYAMETLSQTLSV